MPAKKISVNCAKFPKSLRIPYSSDCRMFMIVSGNCAGAKRSNRKLLKYSSLQQNKLLSPTEGSAELKQGGGQANDSSNEEGDVTTAKCGFVRLITT
jgi:hypothetical protein